MKKFGFRIIIGIAAFGFGVVAVWALYSVWQQRVRQSEKIAVTENVKPAEISEKKLVPTSPTGKIEVIFKGFIQKRNEFYKANVLVAEFEVINHNNNSASFASYDGKQIATQNFKINNDFVESPLICGTGLETAYLLSGESTIFFVAGKSFYSLKRTAFQVGFELKLGKGKDSQTFWSQKFQIPDEIKSQIKQEMIEFEREFEENQ